MYAREIATNSDDLVLHCVLKTLHLKLQFPFALLGSRLGSILESRLTIKGGCEHAATLDISLASFYPFHIPVRKNSLALQEACFRTTSPDNERSWKFH